MRAHAVRSHNARSNNLCESEIYNIYFIICFSDCELQFGTASTSNMIKISNAFPTTLQMFTISFWLKVPSSELTLYPFSYATSSQTSALSIAIKEDGIMEVGLNGGGK